MRKEAGHEEVPEKLSVLSENVHTGLGATLLGAPGPGFRWQCR
jgi:hypothetical protein